MYNIHCFTLFILWAMPEALCCTASDGEGFNLVTHVSCANVKENGQSCASTHRALSDNNYGLEVSSNAAHLVIVEARIGWWLLHLISW